jgi:hypothetical protein
MPPTIRFRVLRRLVALALAPAHLLERVRRWRRLGLLALYGLILLMTWAILRRQTQLDGLPDVGEQFNGPAFGTSASVPDDRNAFVVYRRATERFRDLTDGEGESFSNANHVWSQADPALRAWVAEHHEAVALLRAGSERPEACLEVPKSLTGLLATASKVEVLRRLSWIGTAALLEAGRLRAEGDPAGAWTLLKAVVRASRQMEQAVPAAQARSHAIIMVQYARGPVAGWAEDPAVSVSLLRRALDDLATAEALTPPLSVVYRSEYLAAEESLANLQPLITERARQRPETGPFDLFAYAPDLEAFMRREPERSRRVLRLLAANDLAWCDRFVPERPAFAVPRIRIYAADPATPPAARALTPDELARWTDSALIAPGLPWRLGELEKWDQIDRWSLGQLKEAVAVPLFTREMGRPPAGPAEALQRYLLAPGHAPDRDEAEPVTER